MKSYPDVDAYLDDAGRWRAEMVALREIMRGAGLDEAVKWGKPCYGIAGGNVAIMQPFKACLGLMFFKGALMADPADVLRDQGENSQAARRIEFRSVGEVEALAEVVRAYLAEAVALERSGAKVAFAAKRALDLPDALVDAFDADPDLKAAWDALTPGRQRGYVLHISGAKQAATQRARVERHRDRIMAGKGLNDR
jgi:uncharacterized protein YdeI (YjbR/CyaY-like superfamily)